MNAHDTVAPCRSLEQVYLIERDTGLLCRILGLYAARGVDIQRADYAYASLDVMTLKVAASAESPETAETLRVLVAKAATLIGVMAAAMQPPAVQPSQPIQRSSASRRLPA
jgi:hypothetical protein